MVTFPSWTLIHHFNSLSFSSPLFINCRLLFFFFWNDQRVPFYKSILVWAISLLSRVFANGPGNWVQSKVESYQRLEKWYLMLPCLTLSIIRYGSRVEWRNPGKGVAIEKGAFRSPLTVVTNFTYTCLDRVHEVVVEPTSGELNFFLTQLVLLITFT